MTADGRCSGGRELRTGLGAYVLGQLTPAQARSIREHLDECAACRAELAGLRPAADALADLRSAGDRDVDASPPPDLGDRVAATVGAARRRDERRGRRRIATVGTLAGGTVAAALVGGLVLVGSDEGAPPRAGIPLETVPVEIEQPGVTAGADVVAHSWGVEVKLSARGFTSGETYRVAVVQRDGQRSPAGEFVGTGIKPMVCNLNSAVLRARAEGFEVRDDAGRLVVVSHF